MAAPKRPSALKHGLTSRITREAWSGDMLELAEVLMGVAPRNPAVVESAREAAEAILYLRRVQQCRLHVLEEGTLRRSAPTETLKALALQLSHAVRRCDLAEYRALREEFRQEHDRKWLVDVDTIRDLLLNDEIRRREQELRRIADYERRAHSTCRKSLRRLDFERIEAERQSAAAQAECPDR